MLKNLLVLFSLSVFGLSSVCVASDEKLLDLCAKDLTEERECVQTEGRNSNRCKALKAKRQLCLKYDDKIPHSDNKSSEAELSNVCSGASKAEADCLSSKKPGEDTSSCDKKTRERRNCNDVLDELQGQGQQQGQS
ncbi:MAG: hypothetical protein Nk1A_7500 [Endomicrobiia bacterium]|nr:MAG: hypothetical protein Nk1A_7500 [Endomicrobiia bacterium]